MTDSSATNDRPAYWDKCEEMDFRELRKFIDDCLDAWRESRTDEGCPDTREEFEALAAMLRERAGRTKKAGPEPRPESKQDSGPPPPSHDVPYVPYFFQPSEQLEAARKRREKTGAKLADALADPLRNPSNRRYIEELEADLRVVEREIAEREPFEREQHEKRLGEYLDAEAAYNRDFLRWQAQQERKHERREYDSKRMRIVRRIEGDIKRVFADGVPMTEFQWEAVPSGKSPVDVIMGINRERKRRNPGFEYDESRLEKVKTLEPVRGYSGKGKSRDYAIFTFEDTPKALLECPQYGNAAFVIESNLEPQRWLKMNKQQLIEHPDVTKIPHREGWFEKIKRELGLE